MVYFDYFDSLLPTVLELFTCIHKRDGMQCSKFSQLTIYFRSEDNLFKKHLIGMISMSRQYLADENRLLGRADRAARTGNTLSSGVFVQIHQTEPEWIAITVFI